MHYLPVIAMFLDAAPNPKPSAIADTALKIVSALIPLLLTGAFKWFDDHGLAKRRANLIDQIAKTAKNYAELPELPAAGDATERLRKAFQIELENAYRELTLLQTQVNRRPTGASTIGSTLKSVFLWYRPRGFAAWALHLGFYACLVLIAFMAMGFMAASGDPQAEAVKSSTGAYAAVVFTFFSIPPLILRHFAAKIHRRQCARVEDAEIAAAVNEPVAAAMQQ